MMIAFFAVVRNAFIANVAYRKVSVYVFPDYWTASRAAALLLLLRRSWHSNMLDVLERNVNNTAQSKEQLWWPVWRVEDCFKVSGGNICWQWLYFDRQGEIIPSTGFHKGARKGSPHVGKGGHEDDIKNSTVRVVFILLMEQRWIILDPFPEGVSWNTKAIFC